MVTRSIAGMPDKNINAENAENTNTSKKTRILNNGN